MSDKLTDTEAEAMLAQLAEHFHQPVMPVERYCDAFRAWFKVLHEGAQREGGDRLRRLADAASVMALAIRKSNLLGRLIYGGEQIRSRQCPIHKGRWSGISACPEGCGSTGWVPNDWPEGAPRCTLHPERPAVSRIAGYLDRTPEDLGPVSARWQCWECYRASWPA